MLHIRLIALGTLKESYWRDAVCEYQKRLGAYAKVEITELKEYRLSENPSRREIDAALEKEGADILSSLLPRSFVVALCVEGKQLSSEELADRLADIMQTNGALTLIIGSSHGLSPSVKAAAQLRLSVSRLTFPHQMMRAVLLEAVYRSLSILAGGKYHK
ncbi:MAG: 23S rRNA (pseudouridine(1915)-N(3))-methyltransferase RlmH [Ruminococcaceae bacterium]|nr:23S rRNA (pseudouridine(1915)-N(3))-methyltransferase RlmH [Oscillospiraceae bacterium]